MWQDKRLTDGVLPEFYLGAPLSGAQVHRHRGALNALAFGVKHWYLFSPLQTNWGPGAFGMPVSTWVERILPRLRQKGLAPIELIQVCAAQASKASALAWCDSMPFILFARLFNRACRFYMQQAGEVLFVPNEWGHAVLNLAEVVGVSTQLNSPGIQHQLEALMPRVRDALVWDKLDRMAFEAEVKTCAVK